MYIVINKSWTKVSTRFDCVGSHGSVKTSELLCVDVGVCFPERSSVLEDVERMMGEGDEQNSLQAALLQFISQKMQSSLQTGRESVLEVLTIRSFTRPPDHGVLQEEHRALQDFCLLHSSAGQVLVDS
ncbi:hypothetical protein AGIG_G25219 [Arapaima gigas]